MGYECLDLFFSGSPFTDIFFRLTGDELLDLFFSGSWFTTSIQFSELCHFCWTYSLVHSYRLVCSAYAHSLLILMLTLFFFRLMGHECLDFFHAHGLLIWMLRFIISGYGDMHAEIHFVQHGEGKLFEFIHTIFLVRLHSQFTDMNAEIYLFLSHGIWMLRFFSGEQFTVFFQAQGIWMLRFIFSGWRLTDINACLPCLNLFCPTWLWQIIWFHSYHLFVPLMLTVYWYECLDLFFTLSRDMND
jgi:hypothetical protein